MKPIKDIRNIVKRLNVKPEQGMRSKVLSEALEIQKDLNRQRTFASWNSFFNSGIIKLAALIGVMAIVLISAKQLIPKADSTQNFSEQPDKQTNSVPYIESGNMGLLTLAQQIARATHIVRTVLIGCNETSSIWKVKKVIYGNLSNDIINVDYFPVSAEPEKFPESMQKWWRRLEVEKGRTLTAEEIWKEFSEVHSYWPNLGREVILFLDQRNESSYSYQGCNYDVPPEHSLDNREKLIQQVIESGDYKRAPDPGNNLDL